MSDRKLDQLECMRGIAALVVVGWHLRLGFSMRPVTAVAGVTMPERLFDAVFNAGAAVTFFFVLSGAVLTLGYFRSGDLRTLGRGALKRWPRLAGACTVAALTSWALFAAGGYHYDAAAAITGSSWLATFGGAQLPTPFLPTWHDAMRQGLFTTFYSGENYYNSSLWTMRPEIVGSLISFGMAPLLRGIVSPWAVVGVLLSASVMLMRLDMHIPSFMMGVLLARFARGPVHRLTLPVTLGLVVLGLILLTFQGPMGPFSFLSKVVPNHPRVTLLVWDIGAVLLIFAAMSSINLARGLSGYWAQWLGRLSFPIYLIHLPVLCSLGAYVYVRTFAVGGAQSALLAASTATLLGTFLAAIPLAWFDRWWVGRLNFGARYFVDGRRAASSAHSTGLSPDISIPK